MCKILKMPYVNGSIVVEVTSRRELTGCMFELYLFDFLKGDYNFAKPKLSQAISPLHLSQDSGIYRFTYELPSNCKVKCVIRDGEEILVSREKFIGDRFRIKVTSEPSEIGHIYKIKSDISISRKLIFYKSPVSETHINLPDDIIAGDTLMFTIRGRDFKPKFENLPEFIECFNIES